MTPDYFSFDGTDALSQRIAAYWTQRGYEPPEMWVETTTCPGESSRRLLHMLRSDMLGGLPRRRAA